MSKVDISRARVQRLIDMDAVPNYVVAELLNEVERLQSSITGAMDHLSNGNVEAGARLLRECFWGTAQETRIEEAVAVCSACGVSGSGGIASGGSTVTIRCNNPYCPGGTSANRGESL